MESIVEGKSRLRKRQASRQSIQPEQVETFFTELADSCNVERSARTAGISKAWVYERRTRDAEFRRRWGAAVREGYSKLELILLERAMKGTPKLVRTGKGDDRKMREYSTALAVALLRRHADTADSADYEPSDDELKELRDKLLDKLEGLRKREQEADPSTIPADVGSSRKSPCPQHGETAASTLPEQAQGGVETKGRDAIGLIRWALGSRFRPACP